MANVSLGSLRISILRARPLCRFGFQSYRRALSETRLPGWRKMENKTNGFSGPRSYKKWIAAGGPLGPACAQAVAKAASAAPAQNAHSVRSIKSVSCRLLRWQEPPQHFAARQLVANVSLESPRIGILKAGPLRRFGFQSCRRALSETRLPGWRKIGKQD